MSHPLKIAFVVVDDRFTRSLSLPFFGAAPTALLQGFEELEGEIEIHIVCCTMGDLPSPDKLGSNIWFHSINVPKWGFLRSLHLGCYFAVKRMIKEFQPDIVHAQGTERWCAISTAFLDYPKLLTIHGNLEKINLQFKPKPRIYWSLQTLLQKIAVPRFDGIFCNSDYTQACLKSSARCTWRIDNPIRKVFTEEGPNIIKAPYPTILNVGIFQERKRQLELLILAKKLFDRGVKVVFRFIGRLETDEYGMKCRLLIEAGERAGYVEYAGTKTAQELVFEMDRAQGFVHCPSEEAFGLVVAESLARGLKFFGTAVGGVIQITQEVPGCELYDINDWNGMAQGIENWIISGAEREPSAADCIKIRYTPALIAKEHLHIYREIIAESNTSRK